MTAFDRAWGLLKGFILKWDDSDDLDSLDAYDDSMPSESFNRVGRTFEQRIADAFKENPNAGRMFGGPHGVCPYCDKEAPRCSVCGEEPYSISHMVGDDHFLCDECFGKTCLNTGCLNRLKPHDFVQIGGSSNPDDTYDASIDRPQDVVCGDCAARGLQGVMDTGEFGCCSDCEWCSRGISF